MTSLPKSGVEHEHVVAGTAGHGVVTSTAGDRVVAAQAAQHVVAAARIGDDVGKRIAGAVDGGERRQVQVLDVGTKREGDGAVHRIGAGTGPFRDGVAGTNEVGVIADPAGQDVGRRIARERVVARTTGDVLDAQAARQSRTRCGPSGPR